MNDLLSRRILELKILSDSVCNGKCKENIDVGQKILFLIDEYQVCSPKLLIGKLGLQKSNLALACAKLVQEGKIEKSTHQTDKRQVFYKLTPLGKSEVNQTLKNISSTFRDDEISKKDYSSFEKVCEILNKKV